jgi:glycosyltransferase involved in cell wall biosynthesis
LSYQTSHSSLLSQRPPTGRGKVKVAAVIPAYNEAPRIRKVLQALKAVPEVDEIIVMSDGSTDRTYEVACSVDGVRAFQLAKNRGKGGAMRQGAERTDAEVLVFFDADLVGLKPEHVRQLITPVCNGDADMAMGIFRGGRWATDIAQKFSPGITGQRAIRRDIFLEIPGLDDVGYGIELAITYFVRHQGYVRKDIILQGITHPMKEEKLGPLRGAASRAHMYWQMWRFHSSYKRHGAPPPVRRPRRGPSIADTVDRTAQ